MNTPPKIVDTNYLIKLINQIYTESVLNASQNQARKEVAILKEEFIRKKLENKDPIKKMRSNIRACPIYEEFNDYIANIKSNEK